MTQKLSPEQKVANARVRKGAKFLDEIKPEWAAEICPDELQMDFPDRCILGQTFNDYWDALGILKLNDVEAVDMGFNVELYVKDQYCNFDHLHIAWEHEVFKRRMVRRGYCIRCNKWPLNRFHGKCATCYVRGRSKNG